MDLNFHWLKVSRQRLGSVIQEIDYGCEPGARFYALVASSTLIACLGLIANSTAVIIGAMLVAPLMTPIFGIALSLVRGDTHMLGRAVRAELLGFGLGVGLAAIFGSLPLALAVTPEMLARTQPNLLDLLVAVLAGFAGAYAMTNEHLSPALPGVAIATAIVPPVANTGLCLAVGAYQGAYGSFLLFLANFLSILMVSSLVFIGAGLRRTLPTEKWGFVSRFGMPGLGFLMVAVLLTQPLVRIVQDRYLTSDIQRIISSQLGQLPTTAMFKMNHEMRNGKLYILGTVRTPRVISPNRVKIIQEDLSAKLHMPTALILRCVLTKDISATGSTNEVTAEDLNGSFLATNMNPEVLQLQLAEQALREVLASRPEIELLDVELMRFPSGPVVLATLQGPRVLIPSEVKEIQTFVQRRLQDSNIGLLVRCLVTVDVAETGRVLYGWSHFGRQTFQQHARMEEIKAAVKDTFQQFDDIFATNVDAAPKQDDTWQVRVEVEGARVISPREAAYVEKQVAERVQRPVKIFFWSRPQAMVTPQGYDSVENFTRKRLEKTEAVGASRDPAKAP
jgi:uncharacterized hydrophobic protein (TIGR00271 family)